MLGAHLDNEGANREELDKEHVLEDLRTLANHRDESDRDAVGWSLIGMGCV